jgi:hypothetical protein
MNKVLLLEGPKAETGYDHRIPNTTHVRPSAVQIDTLLANTSEILKGR